MFWAVNDLESAYRVFSWSFTFEKRKQKYKKAGTTFMKEPKEGLIDCFGSEYSCLSPAPASTWDDPNLSEHDRIL